MSGREGYGPERPGPDYPSEWDSEPDEQDEHDRWHPYWIEGCSGCVDRADWLEKLRCTCVPYPYGDGPEIDCPQHGAKAAAR